MSFTSHTAGTHNHLARKVKKHPGINNKTANDTLTADASDATKKERPFGRLQFGSSEGEAPAAYKPIFRF